MEDYKLWQARRKVEKMIRDNHDDHIHGKIDQRTQMDRERELKKLRDDLI